MVTADVGPARAPGATFRGTGLPGAWRSLDRLHFGGLDWRTGKLLKRRDDDGAHHRRQLFGSLDRRLGDRIRND